MTALFLLLAACAEGSTVPRPTVPRTAVLEPPAPVPFALPSGPGAMTPSFGHDGQRLLMVWQEAEGEGARVRFSARESGSWTTPVDLARGPEVLANWADYPAIAVAPDGSLVAHWLRKAHGDHAYDLQFVRSADHGARWIGIGTPYTDPRPAEHGFVSYVSEPGGLRVFWLDGRDMETGGATALRTSVLGPTGFGPEEVVDPRVCDCCGTAAVRTGDRSLVVYRDRDDADHRDLGVVEVGTAGVTPVGGEGWVLHGCPVNGPAMVVSGGRLATAYFTGASDQQRVRVAFSQPDGTSGPPIDVATSTAEARPLGRVDILAGADGSVLVSWLSSEGADGRVRLRRVTAEGRTGESLGLGEAGTARATGFPRLVRDGDGVVAAWTTPEGIEAVRFRDDSVPPVGTTPASAPPAPVITKLPDFNLQALDGTTVRTADLHGKPLLLNVWATWCGPCREELPELERFAAAYPEVRVLALSVDGPGAGDAVRKMATRLAPGLVVLHPDKGLAGQLGVTALPRTLLFDGAGNLAWASTGSLTNADLEQQIRRLAGGYPTP